MSKFHWKSLIPQLDMANFEVSEYLWEFAQIFAGQKNGFLSIQTLISHNLHGRNFWKISHTFLTNTLQDPMVTYVQKYLFF